MKQEEEQEQDGEMDPFYKHQNLKYSILFYTIYRIAQNFDSGKF